MKNKAGKDGRKYTEQKYEKRTDRLIANNHPILNEFREYIGNLQPSTQDRYIDLAGKFLDFCFETAGTDNLEEALGYRMERGVKVRTINNIKVREFLSTPRQGSLDEVSNHTFQNRRMYLKKFMYFLMEQGYLDEDLCSSKSVSYRSGDNSEGKVPLKRKEINILRHNAANPELLTCSTKAKRDLKEFQKMWQLYIDISLTTGARFAEVANLTWRDIDTEARRFRFTQKGNRARKNTIADNVLQELIEYIPIQKELYQKVQARIKAGRYKEYEGANGLPEDALFFSPRGTRLSDVYTNKILARLAEGINKPVTCHILRHTCANLLMEETHNIDVVKETLGHKNIETTALYIHSDEDLMRSAIEGISDIVFGGHNQRLNSNQEW